MSVSLYQSDFLKLASTFPDQSFDMVFTSPPFKAKDVGCSDIEYWILYDAWFKEMTRLTKKVCIIIHSATKLNRIISTYPPYRTMVWGKGVSKYSWRWNPIFVYCVNDFKANKYIWSDAFGVSSVQGKWKAHVYQDPETLYHQIIKMFAPHIDSIFDPFMGSGTTGVVAANLGKDFTGCEIDQARFEVSKASIAHRAAVLQLPKGLNAQQLSMELGDEHAAA